MPTLTAATLSVKGSLARLKMACKPSTSAIQSARDAQCARAAVGFEHVAIKRHRPLAEGVQIYNRAKAAAHQALNLRGAAINLPTAVAVLPRAGAARQHAVLGSDPAASFAGHPRRHLFRHAGRAEDRGAAGLNQHAARHGARKVPPNLQRPKLIVLACIVTGHG